MTTTIPESALELRTTVHKEGTLELSLIQVPTPAPRPHEVLIRVEATPLNPSDLWLLLAGADIGTAKRGGTPELPSLTARIPDAVLPALTARFEQPLPVGNEGAGVVVAAGDSDEARALLGKTVAAVPGGMYAQYRLATAALCLELPDGTPPAAGASCFVNPLTALGMTETMKLEGHRALVHTAAASNLGQMLVKICRADGIPLVNIVRRAEQAELLRSLGAEHVCDSSQPDFERQLTEAVASTGATLAFDATGGGLLADQILSAMERAAQRQMTEYNRYGSTTHKQVYVYGNLDRGPTILKRGYGLQWGVAGWLLTGFLGRAGLELGARLRARVVAELDTTFASHYAREIPLREVLSPEAIADYGRQATGLKYLILPQG